jgi:hypothetical protein
VLHDLLAWRDAPRARGGVLLAHGDRRGRELRDRGWRAAPAHRGHGHGPSAAGGRDAPAHLPGRVRREGPRGPPACTPAAPSSGSRPTCWRRRGGGCCEVAPARALDHAASLVGAAADGGSTMTTPDELRALRQGDDRGDAPGWRVGSRCAHGDRERPDAEVHEPRVRGEEGIVSRRHRERQAGLTGVRRAGCRTRFCDNSRSRRGGMAERSKAAVLKTAVRETGPGVRIPLPPPPSLTLRWLEAEVFRHRAAVAPPRLGTNPPPSAR